MTGTVTEKRLALIHRVIIPDEEYPKEYAILVTDHRSIFIRQKKSRSNFWLRREISYGTALITGSCRMGAGAARCRSRSETARPA